MNSVFLVMFQESEINKEIGYLSAPVANESNDSQNLLEFILRLTAEQQFGFFEAISRIQNVRLCDHRTKSFI